MGVIPQGGQVTFAVSGIATASNDLSSQRRRRRVSYLLAGYISRERLAAGLLVQVLANRKRPLTRTNRSTVRHLMLQWAIGFGTHDRRSKFVPLAVRGERKRADVVRIGERQGEFGYMWELEAGSQTSCLSLSSSSSPPGVSA